MKGMTPAARMPIPKGQAGEQRADKRNVGKEYCRPRLLEVRRKQRREDLSNPHMRTILGCRQQFNSDAERTQPAGASSVKTGQCRN